MKKRVNIYQNNQLLSSQLLNYYNEDDFQFKIEEAKRLSAMISNKGLNSNKKIILPVNLKTLTHKIEDHENLNS